MSTTKSSNAPAVLEKTAVFLSAIAFVMLIMTIMGGSYLKFRGDFPPPAMRELWSERYSAASIR